MLEQIKCLGTWTDNTGRPFFIIQGEQNIIHRLGRNKLCKPAVLIGLARLSDWKEAFPSPRGSIDWLAAGDYLIDKCYHAGVWIEPREYREIQPHDYRKMKVGQWMRINDKANYEGYKFALTEQKHRIRNLADAEFSFTWLDTHGEIERTK